jgi:uncharacterized protein YutE (UPF0331/DUF86 family)
MNNRTIKSQSIVSRIDGIEKDVALLRDLGSRTLEEFKDPARHLADAAELHLRYALEGVFNIGAHILSRVNGGRSREYKEIARKLGEYNIVEKQFAEDALIKMAGYRNRLTHLYAEVEPDEIYTIIRDNLGDFEVFLSAIKRLLKDPARFGLTIE